MKYLGQESQGGCDPGAYTRRDKVQQNNALESQSEAWCQHWKSLLRFVAAQPSWVLLVKNLGLWVHRTVGCVCETGGCSVPSSGVRLPLFSYCSFYICNRLLFAAQLGKNKFLELCLALISISVTSVHKLVFIAWVKLYFFLSLSCFCFWNLWM